MYPHLTREGKILGIHRELKAYYIYPTINSFAQTVPCRHISSLWPNQSVTYMAPLANLQSFHDDVIKWKHFPRYWPFARRIHQSPVKSPHKGQWRGALMFSLICIWINGWVNNREAGDLRSYRTHNDVTVTVMAIHVLSVWYTANNIRALSSPCKEILIYTRIF